MYSKSVEHIYTDVLGDCAGHSYGNIYSGHIDVDDVVRPSIVYDLPVFTDPDPFMLFACLRNCFLYCLSAGTHYAAVAQYFTLVNLVDYLVAFGSICVSLQLSEWPKRNIFKS